MVSASYTHPNANIVLSALTVAAFAIGLDTFVVIGVLNEITTDLSITPKLAGWLVTIYALSYALLSPLLAWMLGKANRKTLIIASLSLFTLGNLLCALSDNYSMMAFARILAATGAAIFTPFATSIASQAVPAERKGLALSLIFGGMTVSQVIGVPIATLIAKHFDWRYSFYFVAFFGIASIALIFASLNKKFEEREEREDGKNHRLSHVIFGLLATTFFAVTSEFVVYSFISMIFHETTYNSSPALPIILFSYGLGAFSGNILTGLLTDRIGPALVFFASISLQTLLLVFLILASDHGLASIVISFAWGIVSYMYLVPIQHRLLSHAKSSGDFVLALNSSVIYLGISVGSWIGGLSIEISGIISLAIISSLFGLISLIIGTVFASRPPPC